MKIPSNRVSSVVKYFREQLAGSYEKEEIESFIFYSFNTYMGFSRMDIVSRADETMSESMLLKFNFAVKDLKRHRPIQYILGETEFYGLKLKVDERALIPRPETEELVHLIIDNCGDKMRSVPDEQKLSILDIGTGSGCIPIALKKNIPAADVIALDVSTDALALAEENAKLNSVSLNFINADILDPATVSRLGTYDIIVSNPPYVLHSEKSSMQPNVLDHEPHLALFVNNDDPLLFYRVIMDIANEKLKPGGKIYFEINEQQGEALKQLAEAKGFTEITLVKDMSGKDRIIHMRGK
jgi:release factor glutamine methyltransferase